MKSQIGLIGLAVMGRNFALNFSNKNIPISVYNRTSQITDDFIDTYSRSNLKGFISLQDFVNSLEKPRKILLIVKAGRAVDNVIQELIPLLDPNDTIIDCGNSYFKDTQARQKYLQEKEIQYIGMGISGGEEGALNGPSLMPGGEKEVVEKLLPLLEKVAAPSPTPCVAYMGNNGAGHYVKMIHNGIEYADMQLIAEIYHLGRKVFKMDNLTLSQLFEQFQKTELNSYLVEITAKILRTPDSTPDTFLVDKILDVAEAKGTGKWTVQEAVELDEMVPSIMAAISARSKSKEKRKRQELERKYKRDNKEQLLPSSNEINLLLQEAMLAAKILSYAQGIDLLQKASEVYQFDLNLSKIAKVWRGGCIIRSSLLNTIADHFEKSEQSLLFSPFFQERLQQCMGSLRKLIGIAQGNTIPVGSLSGALFYFDLNSTDNLPMNLIQAQRDYFGAHEFARTDRPGRFHYQWSENGNN